MLGDRLYGGPPAERLFLHAWRLAGAPLPRELEAPLPATFARALHGSAMAKAVSELRQLVRDAATRRAPLLAQTNAFRLLQGDAEGLPGVEIDVVGRFARVSWRGDDAPSDAALEVIASEARSVRCFGMGAAPPSDSGGPSAAAPADALVWRGTEPSGPIALEEGSARFEWTSVAAAFAELFRCSARSANGCVLWWREEGSWLSLGAGVGGVLLAAAAALRPHCPSRA